uniref:Secretory peptide n=1 Tax=Heteropoda venatoria TaxID=152925 RepID=A0A088BP93_HETVE|nr:secretory peptide [Heteropoda venatoria]
MTFILTVVVMAVSLFVLVSADLPEFGHDALDMKEGAREVCAEVYKSCDTLKCCKGRPCRCNIIGQFCKCEKTFVDEKGIWGNWD